MTSLFIRRGNLGSLPLDLLLSAIPSMPRHALDRLVERAIDQMDERDGDTDLELNGDELDGSMGEDDFHDQSSNWLQHPGCPVSDPGGCEHDGREEEHPIGEFSDFQARAYHRRRIRQTRCGPRFRRRRRWFGDTGLEVSGYELLKQPVAPSLRTLKRRHPQLRSKRKR